MEKISKIANKVLTYGCYYKEEDIIRIIMQQKKVNKKDARILFLEMKHTSVLHASSEKFYYLI